MPAAKTNNGLTWTNKTILISKLIEWKGNPRKINQDDFNELCESFKEFGQARTLTVNIELNGKHEIIGGNQSKKVLKELGYKQILCNVPNRELTEQEKRKLSIKLNHTSKGEGTWDLDKLQDWDLDDLNEWGLDIFESDTGYEKAEKEAQKEETRCEYCGQIIKNKK